MSPNSSPAWTILFIALLLLSKASLLVVLNFSPGTQALNFTTSRPVGASLPAEWPSVQSVDLEQRLALLAAPPRQ